MIKSDLTRRITERCDAAICPESGGLCCKTRKLQRQEFFAKTRSGRRSPIRIPSVAVPKSPVSLTREDQSPHVFTRKTRLQPAEFLITCAKRLLQHNQGQSGSRLATLTRPAAAFGTPLARFNLSRPTPYRSGVGRESTG